MGKAGCCQASVLVTSGTPGKKLLEHHAEVLRDGLAKFYLEI
jgi:hypothetical protein